MAKRIWSAALAAAFVCCLLAGCQKGGSDQPTDVTTTKLSGSDLTTTSATDGEDTDTTTEETTTTAGFTVETNASGNTVVVDDQGNVIADSGDGDTIETGTGGEIVITDEKGETKVITTPPTVATTAPTGTKSHSAQTTTTGGKTTTAGGKVTTTTAGKTTTTTSGSGQPALTYKGILPGSTEAGTPFATLAKAPADKTVTVSNGTKQFGRFLLTTADNATLPFNIACYIGTDRITAVVPADTDLSKVKANFTYYGKNVTCNGAELVSRSTVIDLTQDAALVLNAKDGTSTAMTLHVEKLATGLPSMSLSVSGFAGITSTVDYKNASFSLGGGSAYSSAAQVKGADCSVKGRGNTSWTYDKKCYTLRFDTKYQFLGLPESKNYVLLAMYADQSLMRYRLGEYLSEAMGLEFTMNMRYVDLWLNGEYAGVYALTEKIEVEKNHVNITDYTTSSVPVNQIGYLLEFDDHLYTKASAAQRAAWTTLGKGFYDPAINEAFFYANTLSESWIMLRTTNAKSLTAEHVNYIYAVVNNAMAALKAGDYKTISACIDVESFVKWYLIEEYLNNTDADMTSSVYMYIDVGGKLKLGPLWDMDNCAGNHTATASATSHALYDSTNGWFHYLFRCSEARAILKTQWSTMKGKLSGVGSTIDSTATLLKTAAELNFDRWATLGHPLSTQPAAVGSANTYQKQVDYLKDFLTKRQAALDSFYSTL